MVVKTIVNTFVRVIGFDHAKDLGMRYKDYDVWLAFYDKDESISRCMGYPPYFLVRGLIVRPAGFREQCDILDRVDVVQVG
ncbi:MAG: hypothetical protein PUE49_06380 [Eggerthellales bacterium]|nr:hypothetical protein [Eggerthellales bacterium]